MSNVKLTLSDEQFWELHKIKDATRPSSDFIKVPRASLVNVLEDYSVMLAELERHPRFVKKGKVEDAE